MKAVVFDTHDYDRRALSEANANGTHALTFLDVRLDEQTAKLAEGFDAAIAFVNDHLDEPVLERLAAGGVRLVAMRCAGHNNLDLAAATRLGITVVTVPSYTPHAVAEHVFALTLSLLRSVPRAVSRVRDGNFSVEGLVGSLLCGKTFGIVGFGQIGRVVAGIARGFGCRVVIHDPYVKDTAADVENLPLEDLLARSDVISLHSPLTPQTRHLINAARLAMLKEGAVLINTGRGALVDTLALIETLKADRLGGVGLDVYELEEKFFYTDWSNDVLPDDVLARLLTFRKVLVTSHMGFLTREALAEIAQTTLRSLGDFEAGQTLKNRLS
ncbi:2-hydroxyacid dehydrogenase [Chitinasiproducens palmae]|uniref:D-lactate dehydrogenase n=1 Tax=Chitinasiproducens palmae TaxID=1770053 RepID=A0A1H2PKI3_9BURK|nr:2-hydroxyacid dehydrogenase [Chitinasiproducens palmae]SDV46970.1 D-lactate dehydrogenase [Chitinasiproducens palmae]